jgi:hypothetical protein
MKTDGQAGRQTDGQAERQAERQRERQAERQRERQAERQVERQAGGRQEAGWRQADRLFYELNFILLKNEFLKTCPAFGSLIRGVVDLQSRL